MKKNNSTPGNQVLRRGRTYLLLAVMTLLSFSMSAQNGRWYFGANGGMSFTTSGTVPLAGSVMNQSEGCASIVDASNNVIMYTDGTRIWNGNHVNQGYTLGGAPSSTQNTIIVPIPGSNCTKYYIFTVSAAETNYGVTNAKQGLRVSLASVTGTAPATTITIAGSDLDVNLFSGAYVNDLTSEKLCATSDNAGGYWVMTHGVGLCMLNT